MENPATHMPLHKEISAAYYLDYNNRDEAARVNAVLEVVQRVKPEITAEQVKVVFDKHKKQMEDHVCGLSLCALVVNELNLK